MGLLCLKCSRGGIIIPKLLGTESEGSSEGVEKRLMDSHLLNQEQTDDFYDFQTLKTGYQKGLDGQLLLNLPGL